MKTSKTRSRGLVQRPPPLESDSRTPLMPSFVDFIIANHLHYKPGRAGCQWVYSRPENFSLHIGDRVHSLGASIQSIRPSSGINWRMRSPSYFPEIFQV